MEEYGIIIQKTVISGMVLAGIEVFVKVVETGSFSAAAKALSMPLATVSAKIARLEASLGASLIQRSTRRMRVTDAGRAYYIHCADALRALEAGERELSLGVAEPSGLLRLTASTDGAQLILPELIQRFVGAYPRVSVEVVVTNARLDLIAAGLDLALRAGPLKDSSLQSRRLGSVRFGLFASPHYLAARGEPTQSADLEGHDVIAFSRAPQPMLHMISSQDTFDLDVRGRVSADDMQTLRAVAEQGVAIALLPEAVADIGGRSLRRVLPQYRSEGGDFHLVYPSGKLTPINVRTFIDMAVEDRASRR